MVAESLGAAPVAEDESEEKGKRFEALCGILIALFAAVLAVAGYVGLILLPAWTSYGRWWERFAAAFLSLYILAALLGIGDSGQTVCGLAPTPTAKDHGRGVANGLKNLRRLSIVSVSPPTHPKRRT